MDDRPPVGYGLPGWLDTRDHLSADETRALGEVRWGIVGICAQCRTTCLTQSAHIVRRGMGGKPKGTTGPTVQLCDPCHDEIDEHKASLALAVNRKTGLPVVVAYNGQVTEEPLKGLRG